MASSLRPEEPGPGAHAFRIRPPGVSALRSSQEGRPFAAGGPIFHPGVERKASSPAASGTLCDPIADEDRAWCPYADGTNAKGNQSLAGLPRTDYPMQRMALRAVVNPDIKPSV